MPLVLTTATIVFTLTLIVAAFAYLAADRPIPRPSREDTRVLAIKEQMRLAGLPLKPVRRGARFITRYQRLRLFIRFTRFRPQPGVRVDAKLPPRLRHVRVLIADSSAFRRPTFEIGVGLLHALVGPDCHLSQLTDPAVTLDHTFRIAGDPAPLIEHILRHDPRLRQILIQTPPGLLVVIRNRRIILSPGVHDVLTLYPSDWQIYFELIACLHAALITASRTQPDPILARTVRPRHG